MRWRSWLAGALLTGAIAGVVAAALQEPQRVAIPGGGHGLDLDDMIYVPALHRVVVPAGEAGTLLLLARGETTRILGPVAPHGDTRSVDYGEGILFASNHAPAQVVMLDPADGKVLGRVALQAQPDYVRFLPEASEVWVTEPRAEQIEVFRFQPAPRPVLVRLATIAVPGGPESLVFDPARRRAYTNLWSDHTLVLDTTAHRLIERFPNGCRGSRGLALDAARGHLFVGCREGRVAVLDPAHGGRRLGSAVAGRGVDIVSYSPARRELYVPAGRSAELAVFAVAADGGLRRTGRYPAPARAHCVVSDDDGTVYVCDPRAGRLWVYHRPR